MHAVYYVRPGENEELRYSLRSLEKNTDVDRVSIIGGYPEWLNLDTTEVLPGNPHANKQRNGIANMEIAMREFRGDFLVLNDDFMVLRPMEDRLPFYHKHTLDNHILQASTATPEGQHRKKMLVQMSLYLKSNRVAVPMSFETHVPMRVNGEELSDRVADYRKWWGGMEEGEPLMWRSLYANYKPFSEVEGRRDVITHGVESMSLAGDFASTSDRTVEPILPLLRERFPTPSRWER